MSYPRNQGTLPDRLAGLPSFETGPSRPPSEARSLLVRATRGCSWHRCDFCSSHRTRPLQIRTVAEIERDIESIKRIADRIEEAAGRPGCDGDLKKAAAAIYERAPNDSYRLVAQWLFYGGQTVFLQDADSLIMRTPDLARVLRTLKQAFPGVTRVTSYARSQTAARKSLAELQELAAAGLSRLHVGLESGCDEVLAFVNKGVTAAEHVDAGRKIVESGISLCEYVMPGLGGKRLSAAHVAGTAQVLNQIDPHFIRLRSLMLREDLPLYQKWRRGELELLSDDEVVAEIGALLQRLEVTSHLASDHIENLLQEVEGNMPQDKQQMLDRIARYQALSPEKRLNFRLGRRSGRYARLDDLDNAQFYAGVAADIAGFKARGEDVEDIIFNLKKGFLV